MNNCYYNVKIQYYVDCFFYNTVNSFDYLKLPMGYVKLYNIYLFLNIYIYVYKLLTYVRC